MDDDQIDEMLSEIIKHADYDLWKNIYGDDPEDPIEAETVQEKYREIAKRHMEEA